MSSDSSRYPRRGFLGHLAALSAAAAAVSAWRPTWSFAKSAPIPAELLQLPVMPEAELAERVESLLRFVAPELIHRHTPIAPEENAWPYWERALAAYVEEPSDDEYEEAVGAWEEQGTPLPPEILARVRNWVAANQLCSELIDEGLVCGKLEMPRASVSCRLALDVEGIWAVRDLAKVRGASSRLAFLDGDIDRALSEATAALRMGLLMLRSEGLVVDYLIAHAALGIGEMRVYHTAMSKTATREQAKRAISALNEANDGAHRLMLAHRAELCRWFVPNVAAAPLTNEPEALAKYLVLHGLIDATAPMSDIERQEYARAVRDITFVFTGHPRLFDADATVQLANKLQRQYLAEMNTICISRRDDAFDEIKDELVAWPANIKANAFLVSGLSEPADEHVGFSRRALVAARHELRRVDNLFGKLLIEGSLDSPSRDIAEPIQTRINAAKLLIALHHFERQYGRLPADLAELVSDGWFTEPPLDPYDRQLLRYSPEDRLIWSVGQDGKNDGPAELRAGKYDPEWEHLNMIWKVPS